MKLEGMPDPAVLRLLVSDGQCLVTFGRALVYRFDTDDLGMRNLAIVASSRFFFQLNEGEQL